MLNGRRTLLGHTNGKTIEMNLARERDPREKASVPKRMPPPFRRKGQKVVDPGIAKAVRVLWGEGVETFESCEGGRGHSFAEPTVRFHGGPAEGFRALGVALEHGLRVAELRRYWSVQDG